MTTLEPVFCSVAAHSPNPSNVIRDTAGIRLSPRWFAGDDDPNQTPLPTGISFRTWPLTRRASEEVGTQGGLAVLAEVEAVVFLLLGDAQRDDQVGDLVEDQRAEEREGRDDHQAPAGGTGTSSSCPRSGRRPWRRCRSAIMPTMPPTPWQGKTSSVSSRVDLRLAVHGEVADHAGDQADDDALADP